MKKRVLFFLVLIINLGSITSHAQTCSCHELLDSLVTKVETDYAGYIHKVKEPGDASYENFKENLRAKSEGLSFLECYDILESYVKFFHDGHLFIAEFPRESPAQVDSLYRLIKHFTVPEKYPYGQLSSAHDSASKDSIEGIWKDTFNEQIAIVKKSENLFYGVIQQSNIPKWGLGMVRMEIEKIKENQYNVTYYRNDFAKIHFTDLHIYKNVFFPFGIYRLAKTAPYNPEIKYINLTNPSLPIIRIIDKKNILLTIPSAIIDGKYLDSLLDKHDAEIKSTPNLIIDIRGNTGGNYIWGKVYDIANTIVIPSPPKVNGDHFLMLASADDAVYVKDRIALYVKNDTLATKFYDNLISRINSSIGRVIGFSYYSNGPDTAKRIVYKYPAHIAVIMDKGVASAGEAFVMGMKETSSKVTYYGNNTYGMIDYMNVNTIPFGGNGNKVYYLGYPVYFSKDIKTHPTNPTGLAPDIYIPSNTPDWVQWVINDLNSKYKD